MRWSRMHIPTLREDPADADTASHRLLTRAGYLRHLAAGHYSLLPLAVRTRAKIVDIVRAELHRVDAQEVSLPALHPAELWRKTGRWDALGEDMFRLRDRKGADLALGVTHEEVVTALALELNSYRQLPQRWYHIRTRYRDEPRPKAGLVRAREALVADCYSLDRTPEELDRSFAQLLEAYRRIFAQLGVEAVPVEDGDSVTVLAPAPGGDERLVRCPGCGYAASVARATARVSAPGPAEPNVAPHAEASAEPSAETSAETSPASALAAPERFDTPGVRTIDDLATRYGVPADRQIKTLVYVLDDALTLVLLRGDHVLSERKLRDATGATRVRPAEAEEIRAALGASPGSLGAVGVTTLPILADAALRGSRGMVTGANTDHVHLRGVDVDRDIAVSRWCDLREVSAGEPCARCGQPLALLPALAVGTLEKLGGRYAEAFDATVLDPSGGRARVVLGRYTLAVDRTLAAIVEAHHDERGIVWPPAVAPFAVAVVVAQPNDESVAEAGENLYQRLRATGVDVIIDDRSERPGVKFRDVELVGIPLRVTVGKRGLAEGVVEVTERASGATERVPVAQAVAHVEAALSAAAQ